MARAASRDNTVGRGDAASAVDALIDISLAVALRWDATAKIQLSTLLSQTRREVDAAFASNVANNAAGASTAPCRCATVNARRPSMLRCTNSAPPARFRVRAGVATDCQLR